MKNILTFQVLIYEVLHKIKLLFDGDSFIAYSSMNKSDFPLFTAHPDIIYLDNAATTQKPELVIRGVSDFVVNENANIHRGIYSLSDASEQHYYHSKELVAELVHAKRKEIIYTANATASLNLIAQSLIKS